MSQQNGKRAEKRVGKREEETNASILRLVTAKHLVIVKILLRSTVGIIACFMFAKLRRCLHVFDEYIKFLLTRLFFVTFY